jgi:hypothetical protein
MKVLASKPRSGIRGIIVTAALALVIIFSLGGTASAAANDFPIIVKGDQLPLFGGRPVDEIYVFVYEAATGSWKRIPFQIDERVVVMVNELSGQGSESCVYTPRGSGDRTPYLSYVFEGIEGNGLDNDDELVFMTADARGDRAPFGSRPPGADEIRYELELRDGAGSMLGYAYLFTASAPPAPAPSTDYVAMDYRPAGGVVEDTTLLTERYRAHYVGRWTMDGLAVPVSGGGNNTDMIDRVKMGVVWNPATGQSMESEETWDLSSCFLGRKNGPIRVIRDVVGAASGPETTRTDIFYRTMFTTHFELRVHPMTGSDIHYCVDYNAAATPLTYYNPFNPTGVIIDGLADPGMNMTLGPWEMVTHPVSGALFFNFAEPLPIPTGSRAMFWLDDKTFPDYYGNDPGWYGSHGFFLWDINTFTGWPLGPETAFEITVAPLPAGTGNVGQSLYNEFKAPPVAIATSQVFCGDGTCNPGENPFNCEEDCGPAPTETDNLTGLVWAPNGNIMPMRDKDWDQDGIKNDGKVSWQHALDYVAKLNAENYLGHADWHLPNKQELQSLINHGQLNTAAWLNTQGFTNVQNAAYWSSSTFTYYSNLNVFFAYYAWYIDMGNGVVDHAPKSGFTYVWPVRTGLLNTAPAKVPQTGQTRCYNTAGAEIACAGTGQDGEKEDGVAWPSPRFTVNGACISDNLTGLMWLEAPSSTLSKWQEAMDYANGLTLCGYDDWRLPNVNELESLGHAEYTKETCGGPACKHLADWLNTQGFSNVKAMPYWSSTADAIGPVSVWLKSMDSSHVYGGGAKFNFAYAWPVRSEKTDAAPAKIPQTGQTKCYDAGGNEITCAGSTGQDGEKQAGVAWPAPRFTVGTLITCNDNDLCTTDSYNPATGKCVFTAITCDDNNACTTDTCIPATGCVFTPIVCNDNNACTADTCDPATGNCVYTPIANCCTSTAQCNDNNVCTTDTCVNNLCVHTLDNGGLCCPCEPSSGMCDPVHGCPLPFCKSSPCDDNNACTLDICDPVLGCVYTPVNCNDNNACTADSCNPATGCVHTPINIDDNNKCTTDVCDPVTGIITHAPIVCNDNNACTADTCDPATGNCVYTPIFCNDNNACTADSCNPATGCVYTPVVCDDNNLCTNDSCDPATGCVFASKCTSCSTCDPAVGICGPCCPAGWVKSLTTRGGGQKPTTVDLQIQTNFTVINDGCISGSGPSTVTCTPGTVMLVNVKAGTGPMPTNCTWNGVFLGGDYSLTITCPDVSGDVGKLICDNKDSGGKDVDRITVTVP